MAILATLGVSIWLAALTKMFVVLISGIMKMMFLFYIFTHTMGFTVVLYSINSGCHLTRDRGTRFPDWLQISQTFLKKIRNFQ